MEIKAKILVVGSIFMDMVATMPCFPQDSETVMGSHFFTAAGGKGANQAVQASRLGADVTMVGKVGGDVFAEQILSVMRESGVNTDFIKISPDTFTGVGTIQIEKKEDKVTNRICVIPGANMEIMLEDVGFLEEEIKKYDMVILQMEIPLEINAFVAALAKKHGVPVMLNPAPYAPIPDALLSCITYISPNECEASKLSGTEVKDVESAGEAIKVLCKKGIKNVIVTLGSQGAVFGNDTGYEFYPSVFSGECVDPTAAGDSFVGAFCSCVCSGYDEKDAMKFANTVASLTVTGLGAMPSLPDMEKVKKYGGKK